ncbi:MAG: CopG family transcriptional regulator [Anaerolineae bacterium]|nr:CopG family transcriptional regulator [Anaerolineae bacterium]
MEKQNVTLSISKKILRKAKLLAVKRNTSLSSLLSSTIEELVNQEESYLQASQHSLAQIDKGFDFGTQGEINWQRKDLHER